MTEIDSAQANKWNANRIRVFIVDDRVSNVPIFHEEYREVPEQLNVEKIKRNETASRNRIQKLIQNYELLL